jgi:Methyltransferase domain
MKKLSDEQVQPFDTEYVNDVRFESVKSCIESDFPDGQFVLLDVIIKEFPKSRVTVLDNSELLLSKNKAHPQKKIVNCSVEELHSLKDKYDLVAVNWLLHHLVSDTYSRSKQNQFETLLELRKLLTPSGRISIYENCYNGMIFFVTSLRFGSSIFRKLGANTAGVGVCFLSKKQWTNLFSTAQYQLLRYKEPDQWVWSMNPLIQSPLFIKNRRVGHFWIKPYDVL